MIIVFYIIIVDAILIQLISLLRRNIHLLIRIINIYDLSWKMKISGQLMKLLLNLTILLNILEFILK